MAEYYSPTAGFLVAFCPPLVGKAKDLLEGQVYIEERHEIFRAAIKFGIMLSTHLKQLGDSDRLIVNGHLIDTRLVTISGDFAEIVGFQVNPRLIARLEELRQFLGFRSEDQTVRWCLHWFVRCAENNLNDASAMSLEIQLGESEPSQAILII